HVPQSNRSLGYGCGDDLAIWRKRDSGNGVPGAAAMELFSRGHVPEHEFIRPAGRQQLAVRGKCGAMPVAETLDLVAFLPAAQLPDADHRILITVIIDGD